MAGGLRAPAGLRWGLVGALALVYAAASHTLMTQAQDSAWALGLVLGPLVGLGLAGLWGSGHRRLALLGAAAALLLAALAWSGRGLPSRWLYLAQHAGVHLALAVGFGVTLRPGAQPLISALAQRVHGALAPAMARYTRQVTQVWTLYFLAMAATSLALFAAGEFAHWSLLANVLTPLATAALFVGEYLVRYWLHPEFERVSLVRAVQAWRAHQARPDPAAPPSTEVERPDTCSR